MRKWLHDWYMLPTDRQIKWLTRAAVVTLIAIVVLVSGMVL